MRGQEAQATFPARNGLIAFQADKDSGGDGEIYTIKADGTHLRRLTHVKGEAINPDWSPDGSQIAFALNECSVAIINADGTNRRVLPSETPGGCEADASFTPDGSRLVYERYDPPDDDAVWSMNLDGTDRGRIASGDVGAADANVSPDGGTVSFLGQNAALFTASLDGSNVFRVTPFSGVGFKHDWAPDGRQIVITTKGEYPDHKSPDLATVSPDGSHLPMLAHCRGGEREPTPFLSPTGAGSSFGSGSSSGRAFDCSGCARTALTAS